MNKQKWLNTLKWDPKPLVEPAVDRELAQMNGLERSAEALRYGILSTEYWLSKGGRLREWFKLHCRIGVVLGIPGFGVVPIITFILAQFVGWTMMLITIVTNCLILPLVALLAIIVVSIIAFFLRLIFGAR